MYSIATRGYARRTIDAVVSEKQKKQEFVRLLEEEASILRNSLEDAESSTVSSEVTERFLKESGFELSVDNEEGVVKLLKTTADATIEVTFADTPEEYMPKEFDEEAEEESETEVEGEEKEESESQDSESAEEREHAFTVEFKTKTGTKNFIFQCYARNDGSFVVNKLASGDYIPIAISYWPEDLQRELIAFLEPLAINERLSNFIHQYLTRKETEDNVKVLEDFRDFVSK